MDVGEFTITVIIFNYDAEPLFTNRHRPYANSQTQSLSILIFNSACSLDTAHKLRKLDSNYFKK